MFKSEPVSQSLSRAALIWALLFCQFLSDLISKILFFCSQKPLLGLPTALFRRAVGPVSPVTRATPLGK